MPVRDPNGWMWRMAADLVDRADRQQRRLNVRSSSRTAWRPPADVFETEQSLWVIIALAGVSPSSIEVLVHGGSLVVRGERRLPPEFLQGAVRRLELPYGRFERELPLPPGSYELVQREVRDGCLFLELAKVY